MLRGRRHARRRDCVKDGHPRRTSTPRGHEAGRQVLRVGDAGVPFRLEIGPRDLAAGQRDAGPAHRWREGSRCRSRASARAWLQEVDADAARPAQHRDPAPRAQQLPAPGEQAGVHRLPRERRRLRVRRLVRRPGGRGRDQGTDEGDHPGHSRRGVPFRREAPTKCIWTGRPAVAEVVWARAY